MKKIVALMLAMIMVLALAACGGKSNKEMTYAVEAGSAGEAVAQEKGFKIVSVDTQAKALMEVQAGTSDAAIIDSLMPVLTLGIMFPRVNT